MERLKLAFAAAILAMWIAACIGAIVDAALIPLVTVITPVMLLPAGWLFTDGYLRARQGQRDEQLDEPGADDQIGGDPAPNEAT